MSEPLLSAAAYLEAVGGVDPVGPDVVLVFDEGLVPTPGVARRVGDRLRGEVRRNPFRAVHRLADGVDLVVSSPGRAVAGVTLELLAAAGARRVVSVGAAAALSPLPTAARCLVTRAFAVDGGLAYPNEDDQPSDSLTASLAAGFEATPVVAATTDVPFRQTPAALGRARAQAQVLEMECAALFQVGAFVGLDVAAVVVISDHYEDTSWRAGAHQVVGAELERCVGEVAEALQATA